MGLVLGTTLAMIVWIVMWAIGFNSIDGFMVAMTMIALGATGRILRPYLPGRV